MKPCPVCGHARDLFVRTDKLRCIGCHCAAVELTERNTPRESR